MAQKTHKGTGRRRLGLVAVFSVLLLSQLALVSASHNSGFNEILKPLQTIYDLVKYAATVIAGLIMLFAGITYITSGSDPKKRENAKSMVMYVIIGLMVIWATPFVVELILGK